MTNSFPGLSCPHSFFHRLWINHTRVICTAPREGARHRNAPRHGKVPGTGTCQARGQSYTRRMYDPVKDGVAKAAWSVVYTEVRPPGDLAAFVHCFWELRTEAELAEPFELHALPDACVNVLLNLHETDVAGITALHTNHLTLDLGRSFHYSGIQLFPGVWRGDPSGTLDHFVGEPYEGPLALIALAESIAGCDIADAQPQLADFVRGLVADEVITANPTTAVILRNIGDIHSVADMATAASMSTRQLQRTLKESTGFSPHDLLKVLRLQHSFRQDYLLAFADQSHYTHSFRKLTGYTPAQFRSKFDV